MTVNLKQIFEIADIEHWRESAENWNHASLRDQMMLCLVVIGLSGIIIIGSNSLKSSSKVLLSVLGVVIIRSVVNAYSFGKAEYEKRNYKCYDCDQQVTEKLVNDHDCPEK